jgi:hypothetical protein
MSDNTKILNVTNQWQDLTTNVPLDEGSSYIVQAVGSSLLYLFEGENEPAQTDIGLLIDSHKHLNILQNALPTKFWIRSNINNSRLAVSLLA